jgi:hypothetical protein
VDEALARNSMAVEMRGEASVIFVYFFEEFLNWNCFCLLKRKTLDGILSKTEDSILPISCDGESRSEPIVESESARGRG